MKTPDFDWILDRLYSAELRKLAKTLGIKHSIYGDRSGLEASIAAALRKPYELNEELVAACKAAWNDTRGLNPSSYLRTATIYQLEAVIAKAKPESEEQPCET